MTAPESDFGTALQHDISFPIAGGLSIQKLHSKSIYLSGLLNFPNSVPGQPTILSMNC